LKAALNKKGGASGKAKEVTKLKESAMKGTPSKSNSKLPPKSG
jgi:hypothetical protein